MTFTDTHHNGLRLDRLENPVNPPDPNMTSEDVLAAARGSRRCFVSTPPTPMPTDESQGSSTERYRTRASSTSSNLKSSADWS